MIRYACVIACHLHFLLAAQGAEPFIVTNKVPPSFVVQNKVPPAKKAACVCGDGCKCAVGDCPSKCPVSAVPGGTPSTATTVTYRVCENGVCRLVTVPATQAAPACSTCSGDSCYAPAPTGWYPGKFLGRRR